MQKLLGLAVAALALLGAVLWFARQSVQVDAELAGQSTLGGTAVRSEAAGVRTPDPGELDPGGRGPGELDRIAPTDPSRSGALDAPVEADGWVVTGSFDRTSGGGLPGYAFTLAMHRGLEIDGEPLRTFKLVTDKNGRFAQAMAKPSESVCFDVVVPSDPERRLVVYRPYLALLDEGAPEPIEVLVFERDATVHGACLGPDGRPVAGARVSGKSGSATSTADGTFSMRVAAESYGLITASAPGLGMGQVVVESMEPGDSLRLEIVLPPGARVAGIVSSTLGPPIESALVRCYNGQVPDARTDSSGRYAIEHLTLNTDEKLRVAVTAPNFASGFRSLPFEAGQSEATCDFELTPGLRARGLVVGPDGAPVIGAEVWIGGSPNAWDVRRTRSDDSGRFELDGLRAGVTHMGGKKRGLAESMQEVEIRDGVELVLTLTQPASLVGVVHDEQDRPVEGARVWALQNDSYVGEGATTDAAGAFELTGLAPTGSTSVEGGAKGRVRTLLHLEEGVTRDIVLVLPLAGRLAGRVIDAASGDPVSPFTVRIGWPLSPVDGRTISGIESSWVDPGKTFDAADGRWATTSTTDLAPGTWASVEVGAAGYASLRIDAVQVSPTTEATELVHALVRPIDVEVSVRRSPSGAPVEGAHVVGRRDLGGGSHEPAWRATTGAAGVAVLERIDPATVYVHVQRKGRADHVAGPFDVFAGRQSIAIAIPEGQPVEVALRRTDGSPIGGETLTLLGPDPEADTAASVEQLTDSQGIARFDDVTPGRWRAWRRLEGEEPAFAIDLPTEFDVPSNEPPALVVLQPRGQATLMARFTGPLAVPDGIAVRATPASGPSRGALTSSGGFSIEGLEPSEYRLEGWFRDQGRRVTIRFQGVAEIREGDERVDVSLEPSDG